MAKQKTDWVVIATSGPTVDGREIDPKWLTDAAEVYNADERTAMLWPFHASPYTYQFVDNYGHVDALKTEKFDDKIQLKARITPNRFLLEANKAGQKLFTSIDVGDNYMGTGRYYLRALTVTDTPASIHTTRLQFSQGEAIRTGNVEELCFTLQSDDEMAKKAWFSQLWPFRQENDMNEKQFGQLMDAINKTGERLDKLEENVAQFSAKDAPKDTGDNKPEGDTADNSQDSKDQGNDGNRTFTLTTEQGEKLFSTVNAIAGKVTSMEAAFAELSKDVTKLPGSNPAGGETFNLV
ncbi:TPA: GPO family capsid scaffolding protein [Escherichia coli]|nr:GPO family capsid scaffolding protein [Escherichia coli]MED9700683.1 GPO family capsid scaffolding protein [Escherichia coli]HAY0227928.1 capsid protein [Escherichia coli]HEL8019918.1 GPO family capsid scaffolding protein [Escherichia coli]HEL8086187.1 GPO family capsid scaffolding protein [Escherichia coli]